jgi:hypothetical protein
VKIALIAPKQFTAMANTAIGHPEPRNRIAKLFQPDILSQDGLSSGTNVA